MNAAAASKIAQIQQQSRRDAFALPGIRDDGRNLGTIGVGLADVAGHTDLFGAACRVHHRHQGEIIRVVALREALEQGRGEFLDAGVKTVVAGCLGELAHKGSFPLAIGRFDGADAHPGAVDVHGVAEIGNAMDWNHEPILRRLLAH